MKKSCVVLLLMTLVVIFVMLCFGSICVSASDETNLALGIIPTSVNFNTATLSGLTDGDTKDALMPSSSKKGALVAPGSATNGAYVIIDLGSMAKVNNIMIYQGYTSGTDSLGAYELQYSIDNVNYFSLYKNDSVTAEECSYDGYKIDCDNKCFRFVKLICNKENGNGNARVRELEIYGTKFDNVALDKKVEVNTEYNASGVKVVDGNNKDASSTHAWVIPKESCLNACCIVDLGAVYDVNNIILYVGWYSTSLLDALTDYQIYGSIDKIDYTLLQEKSNVTLDDCNNGLIVFPDKDSKYRYIKLVSLVPNLQHDIRVRELEVYGTPYDVANNVEIADNKITGELTSGLQLTSEKTINNNTVNSIGVLNVIAVFDSQNSILDAKSELTTIKPLSSVSSTVSIQVPNNLKDGCYAKAFTFDNDSLFPYSGVVIK